MIFRAASPTLSGLGTDSLTDLPPFRLQPARSDLRGFQQLAELYQHALRVRGPNVDVDCTATLWFDANLAAALGAVGHALQSNEKKTLRLSNLQPRVQDILACNGLFGK